MPRLPAKQARFAGDNLTLNHAVAGLVLSKINPPTCLLGIEIHKTASEETVAVKTHFWATS